MNKNAIGFCGFLFFINGEWKSITVDTRIPKHQDDEITLSNTETQNAYWMCLFEKAYAKAFRTYDVLNGMLVNDYLVDLTGGWAKMTSFVNNKDSGMDESKKKALFEEIVRSLNQKYLIGCMKYDESKLDEDFDNFGYFIINDISLIDKKGVIEHEENIKFRGWTISKSI